MTARIASLGMYDPPWLQAPNDALWSAIAGRLGPEAPARLDRTRDVRAIWHDPMLLLAQTCGYPLMTALPGVVRVVGTPVYDLPGCEGGWHCSFVVVRHDDPAPSLLALRGRRAAFNSRDSNSGMNLLRAAVAPHAQGGRFFGALIETGGHIDSLACVRDGRADTAAIDCVTHGLLARHRPDLLAGTRILARTQSTPVLPFVTRAAADQHDIARLHDAIAGVLPWPDLALVGLLAPLDYQPVMTLEHEAAGLGYPVLW